MDARDAPDDVVALKDVAFQRDQTRHKVLLSYWVVAILAIPLWWSTTSIQRLSLPSTRVLAQESQQLTFPVSFTVSTEGMSVQSPHPLGSLEQNVREFLQQKELGQHLRVTSRSTSSDYSVSINPEDQNSYILDRHLSFGTKFLQASEMPQKLGNALGQLLDSGFLSSQHDRQQRVVQYAPRYRLAFSLLNEDAATGGAGFGWHIQDAIARELSPFLERLSVLHNFTIESQVQFYAPLAFAPQSIGFPDGVESEFGLSPEQLTIFINSAEWILSSSVSNDPVLHFVLFVPSASRRPLRILDATGSPTRSNAFIVPQWGGIMIYNPPPASSNFQLTQQDLQTPLAIFRTQLLALLGVPDLPPGVTATNSDPLTDWQLDALLRARTLETTRGSKEAMSSILKLVNQIEGMPVGPDVRDAIEGALDALDKVYTAAARSPGFALRYSGEAFALASRAFFSPGMLALLYFPAEHKLAVYMPLFAPVAVPLVAAGFREFAGWKRRRRGAAVTTQ